MVKRTYTSLSDTQLVAAVLAGDRDAIVYMFYEKYSATFQYHIYRLFPYKVDIAEMADEFFLHLYANDWQRLKTFDSTKASLNTWISTVSFRFFRDYRKSVIEMRGHITINEKWETVRTDWMQSHDAGLKMDIEKAMAGIKNDRDREIAERLLVKDMEYDDVAKEFGMSVDYVYTVKNRVIKTLRKILK